MIINVCSRVSYRAHESIGKEGTNRPGATESSSRPKEQPSSESTGDLRDGKNIVESGE